MSRSCPGGRRGSKNVGRLRDRKEHSLLKNGRWDIYQGMVLYETTLRTNAQGLVSHALS